MAGCHALCWGADMVGNAACLSHSKPVSNHKEVCACHGDLLRSKPLVGPEKHSEISLDIILDTRLSSGCAGWGKKMYYSGLLAPGTLEQHKILVLTAGLGVRAILNKELHSARFLVYVWFLPWSVRVEGALASGLELGRLCQFWQRGLERYHQTVVFVYPQIILVFLAPWVQELWGWQARSS